MAKFWNPQFKIPNYAPGLYSGDKALPFFFIFFSMDRFEEMQKNARNLDIKIKGLPFVTIMLVFHF